MGRNRQASESTDALLATALEAAWQAGKVLLAHAGEQHVIAAKGYRDDVTEADAAAEQAVLAVLRAAFPEHAILSEEAGALAGSGCQWIVDPLDGTTNYARGHPTFSVAVAAVREEMPLVGVVHDPLRGHTFAARQGGGATLNGRAIGVSGTAHLIDAVIGLDWAKSDADRAETLRRLGMLAPRCRTVRSLGSAALALAYVAAGWLDAYFATSLHPWDTAAASLIIAEAGGMLSGWNGESWQVGRPTLLAANSTLHPLILHTWQCSP